MSDFLHRNESRAGRMTAEVDGDMELLTVEEERWSAKRSSWSDDG